MAIWWACYVVVVVADDVVADDDDDNDDVGYLCKATPFGSTFTGYSTRIIVIVIIIIGPTRLFLPVHRSIVPDYDTTIGLDTQIRERQMEWATMVLDLLSTTLVGWLAYLSVRRFRVCLCGGVFIHVSSTYKYILASDLSFVSVAHFFYYYRCSCVCRLTCGHDFTPFMSGNMSGHTYTR